MKFYVCNHCGNIIRYEKDTGVPVMCCGEKMEELVPGTTDAAQEKHVPAIEINGDVVTVRVGEVEHPMEEEHYIEWIILETTQMEYKKKLKPGDKPVAYHILFLCNNLVYIISVFELFSSSSGATISGCNSLLISWPKKNM